MVTTEIKRQAKKFRKLYRLKDASWQNLTDILQEQGFMVIEFNPVINDKDVETVIRKLGLEENIRHSKGFLYHDGNYRLVFINEKLTDQEKAIVLAHEEAHYFCGHTTARIGRDVVEEFEANEFVHYIMEKRPAEKIREFGRRNKKRILTGVLILSLTGGGITAAKQYRDWKVYEGTYYVTVHGEKYHVKDCVTIQGHKTRRLTKEDVESGRYEPCSVCMPDRNQ